MIEIKKCPHYSFCAGIGRGNKGFGVITEQICNGCPHTPDLLKRNKKLDENYDNKNENKKNEELREFKMNKYKEKYRI